MTTHDYRLNSSQFLLFTWNLIKSSFYAQIQQQHKMANISDWRGLSRAQICTFYHQNFTTRLKPGSRTRGQTWGRSRKLLLWPPDSLHTRIPTLFILVLFVLSFFTLCPSGEGQPPRQQPIRSEWRLQQGKFDSVSLKQAGVYLKSEPPFSSFDAHFTTNLSWWKTGTGWFIAVGHVKSWFWFISTFEG